MIKKKVLKERCDRLEKCLRVLSYIFYVSINDKEGELKAEGAFDLMAIENGYYSEIDAMLSEIESFKEGDSGLVERFNRALDKESRGYSW